MVLFHLQLNHKLQWGGKQFAWLLIETHKKVYFIKL